jgi:methylenetetrahydrofolate dehydrogenase (NADP+) / methenyltetrahydrofolate cyclohydrolase
MTQVLYSKPIVSQEINGLKDDISKLSQKPNLKVVLIGNNPSSKIYVKRKKEFCEKIGALCEIIHEDESFSTQQLKNLLIEINNDKSVHGCLVQLPLPKKLDGFNFQELISPQKDVDGFHQKNIFSIYQKSAGDFLLPCTPTGIIKLLDYYNINIEGKNIVIIGRSLIVGKPLSMMLSNLNATVTLCHSKSKNLKEHTRSAEIIVSAVGNPHFLTSDFFKNDKSQVVIDVGISSTKSNKISGDVDFEKVKNHVASITPVPGGIGPMTILSLAKNLVKSAQLQMKNNKASK